MRDPRFCRADPTHSGLGVERLGLQKSWHHWLEGPG